MMESSTSVGIKPYIVAVDSHTPRLLIGPRWKADGKTEVQDHNKAEWFRLRYFPTVGQLFGGIIDLFGPLHHPQDGNEEAFYFRWADVKIFEYEGIPKRLVPADGEHWDPYALITFSRLWCQYGSVAIQFVEMAPKVYRNLSEAISEMDSVYLGTFEDREEMEAHRRDCGGLKGIPDEVPVSMIGQWVFVDSFIPPNWRHLTT